MKGGSRPKRWGGGAVPVLACKVCKEPMPLVNVDNCEYKLARRLLQGSCGRGCLLGWGLIHLCALGPASEVANPATRRGVATMQARGGVAQNARSSLDTDLGPGSRGARIGPAGRAGADLARTNDYSPGHADGGDGGAQSAGNHDGEPARGCAGRALTRRVFTTAQRRGS